MRTPFPGRLLTKAPPLWTGAEGWASLRTQLQDAAHDLRRGPQEGLEEHRAWRKAEARTGIDLWVRDSSQPRGALYVLDP